MPRFKFLKLFLTFIDRDRFGQAPTSLSSCRNYSSLNKLFPDNFVTIAIVQTPNSNEVRAAFRIVVLIILLPIMSCARRQMVYSNYKCQNEKSVPNILVKLTKDSSFVMIRTFLEGNRFHSLGTWSLNGDTLVLTNSIRSDKDLIDLSYSQDQRVPDSMLLVKLVDNDHLPMSGLLSVRSQMGDSAFQDKDFFFGQILVPSDTQSFRVMVPFLSNLPMSFRVDRSMGNLATLRQKVENPKFYDLYTTRKFLVGPGKEKLFPITDDAGACRMIRDKNAHRLNQN